MQTEKRFLDNKESYRSSKESSRSSIEHNLRKDSVSRSRDLSRPLLPKFCIGGNIHSVRYEEIKVVLEDNYSINGPCSLSQLEEVGKRGRNLLTNFCPYKEGLVSVVQRILGPYALPEGFSNNSRVRARLKAIERDLKDGDEVWRRCTDGFGRLLVVLPTSFGSKFCPTSRPPIAYF